MKSLGRSLSALLLTAAATASAETPQEKAAARALFDDAKRLQKEGKLAEACPKFAESYKISPLLSAKLNYAECLKDWGKTASAWAEYREAAALAAKANDDREPFARERVAQLEKSLARLTIHLVPGADVPGLVIKHDGDTVARPLLDTAVPVDPGTHVVEANAPNKMSWASRVQIGQGATVTVDVPVLGEPTRYPEMPKGKPAPAAPAAEPAAAPVADEGADPGRTRRYLGLGVAGAGAVALVVGTVFGLKAKSSWDDAKNGTCDNDGHCTDQADVDKVNDARSAGTISTVAFGVGLAAVGGGLILYFTAPHAAEKSAGLRIVPSVGKHGFGIAIKGSL
jgi:hypothetical protein